MSDNFNCCSSDSCGCRLDVFPTSRECPSCGERLRLSGRSQLAEFRLGCQKCGYNGPLLSPEELQEVL